MNLKPLAIGEVFTPPKWANFADRCYSITESWLNGATVIDICMGSGNLLFALIDQALEKGVPRDQLPMERLFGLELQSYNIDRFKERLHHYNLTIPNNNIRVGDICFTASFIKADIIFTNPPWIGFCDLPTHYKEQLKPLFLNHKLIKRSKDMLLGNSRVDLSALIMTIGAKEWLNPNGKITAFLPLSLFESSNHYLFRQFSETLSLQLKELYHLTETKAFYHIASTYTLAHFNNSDLLAKCFKWHQDAWKEELLQLDHYQFSGQKLSVRALSQPRQGINTGGAHYIFVFTSYKKIDNQLAKVSNKKVEAILPQCYLYPLISKLNFAPNKEIKKWILLPYNTATGKPLYLEELRKNDSLHNYLLLHEVKLRSRKGKIFAQLTHGERFWGLLGVGPYSFSPYKVVWRASGAKEFLPAIFTGNWQVDQSLQCSVSANSLGEAQSILAFLQQPSVSHYVFAMARSGSKSFALVGTIKSLLNLE